MKRSNERRVEIRFIKKQCPLGSLQTRTETNKDIITEYSEVLQDDPNAFPPIDVFVDIDDPGFYYLADGFKRLSANELIGFKEIDVRIHNGNYRDAILFGQQANLRHGERLSNRDKRFNVTRMLKDEVWREMSNSEIARVTGTTHPFVGKIRSELYPEPVKKVLSLPDSQPAQTPQAPPITVGRSNPPAPPSKPTTTPLQRSTPPSNGATGSGVANAIESERDKKPLGDRYGVPIPDRMRKFFQTEVPQLEEFLSLTVSLQSMMNNHIVRATNNKAEHNRRMLERGVTITTKISEIKKFLVSDIIPYAICPMCKGKENCKACGNMGWVTKEEYEAMPQQLKDTHKTATEINWWKEVEDSKPQTSLMNDLESKKDNKMGDLIIGKRK